MENDKRKYWFFGSKLNTALLLVLIILMVIALRFMFQNKETYLPQPSPNAPGETLQYGEDKNIQTKGTYTYTNHGFSIELPKGYIPSEMESEGGPSLSINMPQESLVVYVTDADFWEKYALPSMTYIGDEKIGDSTFKVYKYNNNTSYWLRKGKIGYELHGDKNNFATFKFVGWPQAVTLDLSSDYTRTYKTLFTAALQKPADFNGHYVVASYGCGSGCMAYGILDKLTGKAYQGPSDDYANNYPIPSNFDTTRYSLNSNLFKVHGYNEIQTYKFENNIFTQVN